MSSKHLRSTLDTQSESETVDQLTALIKEGQHNAFRSRMDTLTHHLVRWPTLFSTLLVGVVYYLSRDDQRELRSNFYDDLIEYTAPQHLGDALDRKGNELWTHVLENVATAGDDITPI